MRALHTSRSLRLQRSSVAAETRLLSGAPVVTEPLLWCGAMRWRASVWFVLGWVVAATCSVGCGSRSWPAFLQPRGWMLRWASEEEKLARFARAWESWKAGEYERAYGEFSHLAFAFPELGDHALCFAAQAAARVGWRDQALRQWRSLAERYPQSVWFAQASAQLARAELERGALDRARHWAVRALAARQDGESEAVAKWALARIDEMQGQRESAAASYREIWRGAKGSPAGQQAKEALLALRALDPSLIPSAPELLEEARWALSDKDWERVRLLAEQALRKAAGEEDSARAATLLAEAELGKGNREDAWRMFWGVAQKYPQSAEAPKALFRLASLLWNADRDTAADRMFGELIQRYPASNEAVKALLARARIALKKGEAGQALAFLGSADRLVVPADLVRDLHWWRAWAEWRRGNFAAAARSFAALGNDDASGTYWRARAEELAGRGQGAQRLYARVEELDRGYYGLQAARRRRGLGSVPLRPGLHVVTAPALSAPELPVADPFHHRRWRLLLAAGVRELAARELLAVLNALPLSDAQQREAVLEALLVTQAYREAVARARTWVELPAHTREQALYPLAYWDAVRTAAEESQVDPLLLLAVMRQESLFEPQAESPAGARGLMQLLPGTAQRAAAALGVEAVKEKLDDPVVNVRLGARYLRELLDRYQSDLTKALAAYNGGEMAADRWVTQAAGCDPDEFVERITYRETREYVKRVLSHYAAYARLYSSSSLAMSRSPRLP